MRYGRTINTLGLVFHPLRILAVTSALSLLGSGQLHAQQPYSCPPAPNYVAPKGAPAGGPTPPANFGEQLTAAPGINLGEAAPAQTGENFAFAAPNFVGDFIGGAAGSGGSLNLGTITFLQTGFVATADRNSALPLVGSNGIDTFTTVQSQSQLFNQIATGAQFAIQNNPTLQGSANGTFVGLFGNVGTTTFNAGNSFATVGGSPISLGPDTTQANYNAQFSYDYLVALNIPGPGTSGAVGVQKLVENSSPIPRDRLLFNYSWFQNVRFTPGGLDVNRFVVGFEKTFLDQTCSFELRAPFASTLSTDQVLGQTAAMNTQFGNLTMYGKALLASGASYAIGAGLGIAVPTADDVNVRDVNGTPLVQVQNRAVQLLPYFGGVYAPNDRLFTQAILQFDTVTSGNPTFINNGAGLAQAGVLNDPTWVFASFNLGYWIYRTSPEERLSGVSPLVELHYNSTMNNTDFVNSGPFLVGNQFGTLEMINMVAGANFELYGRSYISVAYVAPLTSGNDRFFDGELRVLCNRYWW